MGEYDAQCDRILNAMEKLSNSMGDAAVMVKQAQVLAKVSSLLKH